MMIFLITFFILYSIICYTYREKLTNIFQLGYCIFIGSLSLLNVGFNVSILLLSTLFILVHWFLSFKTSFYINDIKSWLIAQCKILPGFILLFYFFDHFGQVAMLKWLTCNMLIVAGISLLLIYLMEYFFNSEQVNS